MSVLILKNVSHEGPGTIAGFLDANEIPYRVAEPEATADIGTLYGVSALVVMGGPMGVYEAADYPQVLQGMRLISDALDQDLPVLGICLGSQMLAEVLGARVYKGEPGQEVGWHDIQLTPEGQKDSAFGAYGKGEAGPHSVFHLHGDTFDIPRGGVRLAGSAMYANQAFRFGSSAYGVQFHMEVTEHMVAEWMMDHPEGPRVLREGQPDTEQYNEAARRFYGSFFKVQ